MEKTKKISFKVLSFCLSFVLLANLITHMPLTADAAEVITVIAGSDYQPSGSTDPSPALDAILSGMKTCKIDPYGVLMCGDYSGGFSADASVEGINAVRSKITSKLGSYSHEVVVQGNHDPNDPNHSISSIISSTGAHDSPYYGVFVLNDDDYGWFNGDPLDMTSVGNGMGGHLPSIQSAASNLKDYLNAKILEGYTKPIFIAAHIPLHYSLRTRAYDDGQYALYIVETLNEAASAGLNIIYLFGHNHSGRSDDYIGGGSAFLTRGDVLYVSQPGDPSKLPEAVPLRFTYMNAGYIGYCANENPGGNHLNMAVFEIRGDEVSVRRCGEDGFLPVGAQGAWWPQQESAATYGTTDAYLKGETSGLEILTPEYGSSNRVDNYSYKYLHTSEFLTGHTYVLTDGISAGEVNAIEYSTDSATLKKVTVNTGADGTYVTGVTPRLEWRWDERDSSYYGTLTGSGGRYLMLVGNSGSTLSTTSSYTDTGSGDNRTMWKLSSSASNGLYSYVYNSYATANRVYLRSTGTSLYGQYASEITSETKPIYAFEKTAVSSIVENVGISGITKYIFKPGAYSSWTEFEKVIRAGLVVTAESGGNEYTTSDYTFGTSFDPTKSAKAVITVFYREQPIGAVTVNTTTPSYPLDKEKGDINGDNKINAKDIVRLKKYTNDESSSSIVYKASDVTGDSVINTKDVTELFAIVAAKQKK